MYSAISDDASTVSQFTRRKAITITTDGTSTPADYQVKLIIAYEPEMQTDFDDIRFNTKAGGYLDYWIESYVASTSAVVWVELSDAITHSGSDDILMFFGNAELSDGGNGDDTFEFFDDFPGSSLDTNKWERVGTLTTETVSDSVLYMFDTDSLTLAYLKSKNLTFSDPSILEYRKRDSISLYYSMDYGFGNDNTNSIAESPMTTSKHSLRSYASGSHTINPPSPYIDNTETWKNFKIVWLDAASEYYIDDVLTGEISTNVPTVDLPVNIGNLFNRGVSGYDMWGWIDWIFARKYIANEPTISYGTIQHQRRTPQFIQ